MAESKALSAYHPMKTPAYRVSLTKINSDWTPLVIAEFSLLKGFEGLKNLAAFKRHNLYGLLLRVIINSYIGNLKVVWVNNATNLSLGFSPQVEIPSLINVNTYCFLVISSRRSHLLQQGTQVASGYTRGLQRLGDQVAGSGKATLFREEATGRRQDACRAEQRQGKLPAQKMSLVGNARSRAGNSRDPHPLLLLLAWGREPEGQPAAEPPGALWPPGPATSPAAGRQAAGGRQARRPAAPRHRAAGGPRHPHKASLQPVVSIHTFCFHTLRSVWHSLLRSLTPVLASVSSPMSFSFSLLQYFHSISSLLCNSLLALYH